MSSSGPASSCASRYYEAGDSHESRGSRHFRRRAKALASRAGWQSRVARARVAQFEARTEKDAFHPMEVAASAAETEAVRARCAASKKSPVMTNL